MDIKEIISTAADATAAAAKADRLGKSHAADKKAATQIVFECVKAASDNHGMNPGEFRVRFAMEAGYSCREYDVDGSFVEHLGEKMPKTTQTIISLCGKLYKERGKIDVENVTELRNALKTEKTALDKAFDAFNKLEGEDIKLFIQAMTEQAQVA
tara:strand:+ start:593 stop:1057 length:465 start_codon:yes stop_codon:yes gene_type:complete